MYKRLIRLGRYVSTPNQSACYYTAKYLSEEINKMGPFQVLFDGDSSKGIPAMSWTIKDEYKDKVNFSLYDFADRLRVRGWQVPDRKSTRLNSSHVAISYAVISLKTKI